MTGRRRSAVVSVAAVVALTGVYSWADAGRVGAPPAASAAALEEAQEALARFDEPAAAQDAYLEERSPNVVRRRGQPPVAEPINGERYLRAKAAAERLPRITTTGSGLPPEGAPANDFAGPWQQLGPGNIGGRTRQVVVDPADANVIYVAAVAGGVWKTTNGGATWMPLDDLMANLAVNSLVMDPGNSQVLYAGTGEGFFNIDGVRGAGIFKTTNGGTTWTQLANTNNSNFHYVNDLVVSTGSSARVYAATRQGVYRSLDGGVTWTLVQSGAGVNGCLDLAIRTDIMATDTVFAACGTFAQGTIYRNTDAGGAGAWTAVYTNAGMGRASLAIAPSIQSTIYALGASIQPGTFNNGLFAVLRSTSNGDSGTWTVQVDNTSTTPLNTVLLSNPPFALGCPGFGSPAFFNQGWYDNVIKVDPADPNRVWAGGVDLFRSDDGGANFGLASYWYKDPTEARYAHADQHAITFHPGYNGTTNRTMFVGNDGGLFRTADARAATATGTTAPCDATVTSATVWTNLNNGYNVTQFYDGDVYPNGSTYFGGTQDNGTLHGTDAGGSNAWTETFGGDGGYVAVDPTNTNVVFLETTGLSIRKSVNGTAGPFNSATSGITGDGGFRFINPFEMAEANPQVLFTGGFFIWRTTNQAGAWVRASAITAGLGSVSALATAPTSADNALVGMSDGFIHRNSTALSTTSTTAWPVVQPRSGYVSSLTFHPTNPLIAYATYSTFGGTHLWRTADGGATWTARDGSGGTAIPDIPAHTVAINPSNPANLYVGTDLGIFVSLDEGLTWARENTGFANVVIEKLDINTIAGAHTLYAFTHGRSAWKVPLGTPALPDLTVAKAHTGNFTQGQTGATYTIVVTNAGTNPTTAAVSMVDTLPAGLTATAISGAGWTCTLATLTCTRSNALAGGASYPAITLTVNVSASAPGSVTNVATVSGGGETNTANNTASDPTTVIPVGGGGGRLRGGPAGGSGTGIVGAAPNAVQAGTQLSASSTESFRWRPRSGLKVWGRRLQGAATRRP